MKRKIIQSIKGFNDILPDKIDLYYFIEDAIKQLSYQYCLKEIRVPLVEKSDLFNKSIGEETEIVTKEMYEFTDKNKDLICLRPEGTASIVRCAMEHNLIYDRGIKKQKYWYYGPMFRHERPQKGRFRQFMQYGVEFFGYSDTNSDIEIITLVNQLFNKLNLNNISLHINSLGDNNDRNKYKKVIFDYLNKFKKDLDEDQLKTLSKNPLRLLDSKDKNIKNMLKNIPSLIDSINEDSKLRFEMLTNKLDELNIKYTIDNTIVRGLDYYNDTVFEWKTTELGSQDAICAGGRYDSLVEKIGNVSVPAIGFAVGIERIVELIKNDISTTNKNFEIPIINISEENDVFCSKISTELRKQFSHISFYNTDSSSSLSSQLKLSKKLDSPFAIIIYKQSKDDNMFTIKYFNKESDNNLTKEQLFEFIKRIK